MARSTRAVVSRRLPPLAAAAALVAACGSTDHTQLRVRVREYSFREGRVVVTASGFVDDRSGMLQHVFRDPNRLTADFLFRFTTHSRWPFLAVAGAEFTPAVRAPDECIYRCSYYLSLAPGRSYLIEVPILILPRECPQVPDFAFAREACDLANGLVRIPNCEFRVTSERACSLICTGEPPMDPDPGGLAERSAELATNADAPPNRLPMLVDAGSDGPADAAIYDTIAGGDTIAVDDLVHYDSPPPTEGGEPPM